MPLDERMFKPEVYVTDGTLLFEVTAVRNSGPATPRQRRQIEVRNCVSEVKRTIMDGDFSCQYTFVCERMTDAEVYSRYKAIGKDYKPEPRPKPPLLSEHMRTGGKGLLCR